MEDLSISRLEKFHSKYLGLLWIKKRRCLSSLICILTGLHCILNTSIIDSVGNVRFGPTCNLVDDASCANML